jgi:hypothetical protein
VIIISQEEIADKSENNPQTQMYVHQNKIIIIITKTAVSRLWLSLEDSVIFNFS